MNSLWQDVRFGFRAVRRSPGASSLAVCVLALGVGLSTATFSIVNAALFRPLPVRASDRLVYEYPILPGGGRTAMTDFGVLEFLRQHGDVFESVTAHSPHTDLIRAADRSVTAAGEIVTANYFDVLGVRMASGRRFGPAEDALNTTERAIVISDDLWTRLFDRDPAAIGARVRLAGHTFTIVGVTVPTFRGLSSPWAPTEWWATAPQYYGADYRYFGTGVIGRIRPGISLEQAHAAVATQNELMWMARDAAAVVSLPKGRVPSVILLPVDTVRAPFHPDDEVVPARLSAAVGVVVAMVLLVATVNIIGVLRARNLARASEMAIRRAIGARGVQLLRQLASESLVLSLAGGTVGVLIALALVGMYRRLTPARYVVDVPFDWRVMGFTLGLAMAIGVLIALATGWQALRANVSGVLGRGGMTVARPTRRLRHALVIPQVAVSLLLLLVAGVHVRALAGIEGAQVGIALGDTAMFDVGWIDDGAPALRRSTPAMAEEQAARSRAFLRSLLDGLHAALGTAAGTVALTDRSPIEDRAEPPSAFVSEAAVGGEVDAFPLSVSPGYFATIGTRVLAGREFDARDVRQSPLVAVVSQSVADRLWPDQSAIGRRLAQAGASTSRSQPVWLTVIGVVADVHPILRPGATTPMVYVSLAQQWRPSVMRVITRTAGMPPSLVAAVTQAVRTADPRADVFHARRLSQVAGEMLYPRRTAATILTMSGLIGLLLAAIGLYAVVSQSVAQRMRELSIRIAVGASRGAVVGLVLREGLVVVAAGIAIGVPLSFVALRVTATLVGSVPVVDPLAFIVGTAVVAGATLLACYGPARRAASVDPSEALRSE